MFAASLNAASWSSVHPGTVFCAGVLVLLVSAIIVKRRQDQKLLSKVPKGLVLAPCLPWLPFVGSSPFMITKFSDLFGSNLVKTLPAFFLKKSKKLGNVIAFYSNSRYTIVLNGRSTIYDAYVKKAVAFADKEPFAADQLTVNPNLNGIISCPYNNSLAKRRNITLLLLKDLGYGTRAMEMHIQGQMGKFIEQADKIRGQQVDPTSLIYPYVGGVIFALMFGRQFEKDEILLKHMHSFTDLFCAINSTVYEMVPIMRQLPAFRKLSQAMKASTDKLFELLKKEVTICLSNGRTDSFTYKYSEKEGPQSVYSDEYMFILRDMLNAGTETTMHTIRWMLIYLANHQDVQQRLHAEVDDFYDSRQRLPSLDDASKLPLVSATILETLRIETLAPLSVAHRALHDTDIHGYFIPEGTMILPNLYSGHMDPDEWDNPSEFRPDRFIDSDGKLFRQEHVISFSMGKRVCLGEHLARSELFLFTAFLLRNFLVLPPEGQSEIVTECVCGINVHPAAYNLRLIRKQKVDSNST